jgi:cell division protein FtsW (lipid II flippase)
MANSIYIINKGINKAIEFRGLKAQYIGYLAGGLVILLILFAVLYIAGIPVLICLPLILILGSLLFMLVYRYSHKYGQYGLLKKAAKRSLPESIRFRSNKLFINLKNPK